MRSMNLGLVLALVVVGSVRAADIAPASDAAALQLMAQCRTANGGAALDRHVAFHETGTVVRDGRAGTYEVYGDLYSLRTAGTHVFDGKASRGGFDGRTVWRIDPDGKVTTSTDPKKIASAKSEAYFTIGAYNWPERFPAKFTYVGRRTYQSNDFDVVEVAPEGATPADLWLDSQTHILKRATVTEGTASASVDIWDHRVVDGTLIGFKNSQIEGDHKMTQILATVDFIPLDPQRFAPPSTIDRAD